MDMVMEYCLTHKRPFTTENVMMWLSQQPEGEVSLRTVRRRLDALHGAGLVYWLGTGPTRHSVWLSMVAYRDGIGPLIEAYQRENDAVVWNRD